MDISVNTRPLLQQSETDSDFEDDLQIDRSCDNLESEAVMVKDSKPLFKSREPNDRFSLGYIIFYLLGTTVLLPWFFFITAAESFLFAIMFLTTVQLVETKPRRATLLTVLPTILLYIFIRQFFAISVAYWSVGGVSFYGSKNVTCATFYTGCGGQLALQRWICTQYWMYKFRLLPENLTEIVDNGANSDLQASFTSYISIASTVPSTIFLIINPICSHRIPLKVRMIGSLGTMLILFIVTTSFVEINTDKWQDAFFALTIGIVVLLNVASAILQSGLFGIVGRFPACYITATVSGQALGGVLAAVAEVVALWLGASPIRSALVYFIMADIFIFFSLLAYIFLSRSVLFKFYLRDEVDYAPVNQPPIVRHISYTLILKKIWVHGMSVWFCFVVTLSVYPAITALINSQYQGNHSAWNDIYFVPVVAYLLFSTSDYMGRLIAGFVQWPVKQSWLVGVMSLLRVGFIPLMLLCNAQPRHNLPVIIHSDLYYILIQAVFGFTNGYLANITMISVPKIVDVHEQETASSMMAAFLGVGLACGSLLGLCMVKII